MSLIVRLSAALAAFSCSCALSQEMAVSPKEIQETWVGRTLVGNTSGGGTVSMTLKADGTAQLSVGKTNDAGTWRLSEQGYCTTWNTIRSGQERCFTVRRTRSSTVFNPDGTASGTFTEIRP